MVFYLIELELYAFWQLTFYWFATTLILLNIYRDNSKLLRASRLRKFPILDWITA